MTDTMTDERALNLLLATSLGSSLSLNKALREAHDHIAARLAERCAGVAEVSKDDIEAARAIYGTVGDAGRDDCFACKGNPFTANPDGYCPTCENRGWLWRENAPDPIEAALNCYRARLIAPAQEVKG